MSAIVLIHCDCGDDGCEAHLLLPVQDTSDARSRAKSSGWDCDVIGGETVDWAPGHTITTDLKAGN